MQWQARACTRVRIMALGHATWPNPQSFRKPLRRPRRVSARARPARCSTLLTSSARCRAARSVHAPQRRQRRRSRGMPKARSPCLRPSCFHPADIGGLGRANPAAFFAVPRTISANRSSASFLPAGANSRRRSDPGQSRAGDWVGRRTLTLIWTIANSSSERPSKYVNDAGEYEVERIKIKTAAPGLPPKEQAEVLRKFWLATTKIQSAYGRAEQYRRNAATCFARRAAAAAPKPGETTSVACDLQQLAADKYIKDAEDYEVERAKIRLGSSPEEQVEGFQKFFEVEAKISSAKERARISPRCRQLLCRAGRGGGAEARCGSGGRTTPPDGGKITVGQGQPRAAPPRSCSRNSISRRQRPKSSTRTARPIRATSMGSSCHA